jgi:hypothetical protein
MVIHRHRIAAGVTGWEPTGAEMDRHDPPKSPSRQRRQPGPAIGCLVSDERGLPAPWAGTTTSNMDR